MRRYSSLSHTRSAWLLCANLRALSLSLSFSLVLCINCFFAFMPKIILIFTFHLAWPRPAPPINRALPYLGLPCHAPPYPTLAWPFNKPNALQLYANFVERRQATFWQLNNNFWLCKLATFQPTTQPGNQSARQEGSEATNPTPYVAHRSTVEQKRCTYNSLLSLKIFANSNTNLMCSKSNEKCSYYISTDPYAIYWVL